jgi:hypothetical protein
VLAAGEMRFVVGRDGWRVAEVTNQSTGYCPEPDSWPAVTAVLERENFRHPSDFTSKIIFRRCPDCGERNIVRDDDFNCAICGGTLPPQWNFDQPTRSDDRGSVRTDRHQLRPVAGDSATAEAVKIVTRAHKTLIWERTRHVLRLRHALREFFPAALAAFEDLAATDALDLLGRAPDPASAAALSKAQITAALRRARRRDADIKAAQVLTALRAQHLTSQPSSPPRTRPRSAPR